jgi:hypothetical protein
MSFEPQVIQAIQRYKRGIILQKMLALAIASVGLLASIAVLVLVLRSSSVQEKFASKGLLNTLRPSLITLGLVSTITIYLIVIAATQTKLAACFQNQSLDGVEKALLVKFDEGLKGVSIAAGIDLPQLVVAEIPGASSTPFSLRDDKPLVALSGTTLNLGLSAPEAEGLMALNVSLILLKCVVKHPLKSWFENTLMLSVLFCLGIGIVYVVVGLAADTQVAAIPFVFVLIGLLMISALVIFSNRFRRIRSRDELLADSIASKITQNPSALMSLLYKLADNGLIGTVSSSISFNSEKGQTLIVEHEESFKNLDARLKNLEAIDEGHWPIFENPHTVRRRNR